MAGLQVVSATRMRRWSPTSGAVAFIAELAIAEADTGRLASVLAASADDVRGCSMLVVKIGPVDRQKFLSAFAAAQALRFPVRICFAVDRRTLVRIGTNLPASDEIGILLDNVDDQTPLADIVNDVVEVVRFEAGFLTKATEHLRTECVLDALLSLAKNIGIATLGASSRAGQASWLALQRSDFDFVLDKQCGR